MPMVADIVWLAAKYVQLTRFHPDGLEILPHLVKTIQLIACGLKGNQVEVRAFRHEDGEFS